MGRDYEDARAKADSMTPEEITEAEAEWAEYEADRDAEEQQHNWDAAGVNGYEL